MPPISTQFFWIDPNKFDRCQHKIATVSMMEQLLRHRLPITYLTSYLRDRTPYPGLHYLETWTKQRGLYRIAFLQSCLRFLKQQMRPDIRTVLIVFPQTYYIGLLAKWLGALRGCKVDIHLDIRTVPVVLSKNPLVARIKYAAEYIFFWKLPLFLSRFTASSFSFITNRMREAVNSPDKPYCIWTSAVKDEIVESEEEPGQITGEPPPETGQHGPTSQAGTPAALGPPAALELLYLGSMSQHRGVEEVVRAIISHKDQMPNFVLRILGGGPGFDRIQRIVREANAKQTIILEGPVPSERVPEYLSKAHAFISPLPDHPWWRVSSPLKLFEYLATGKPLILTDTTPHRDVVPPETPGILWLPDLQSQTIVSAIEQLIQNYDSLRQNRNARLAIARQYTWGAQGKNLFDFLRQMYM